MQEPSVIIKQMQNAKQATKVQIIKWYKMIYINNFEWCLFSYKNPAIIPLF